MMHLLRPMNLVHLRHFSQVRLRRAMKTQRPRVIPKKASWFAGIGNPKAGAAWNQSANSCISSISVVSPWLQRWRARVKPIDLPENLQLQQHPQRGAKSAEARTGPTEASKHSLTRFSRQSFKVMSESSTMSAFRALPSRRMRCCKHQASLSASILPRFVA